MMQNFGWVLVEVTISSMKALPSVIEDDDGKEEVPYTVSHLKELACVQKSCPLGESLCHTGCDMFVITPP